MTTLTPDRISARAAEFDPAAGARAAGRALLTAVAAVMFAVGWLAGRTATLVGAAARLVAVAALWCAAAVALGWREARPRVTST